VWVQNPKKENALETKISKFIKTALLAYSFGGFFSIFIL
tara:strand:- start:468 stop:584 length:117 start_codon:yes stop_codon:yes gene_type:complete